MSTNRLPALSAKAQEAIAVLVRCVEQGFTGTLQFEFKDGVPELGKRIDTWRLGKGQTAPSLPERP